MTDTEKNVVPNYSVEQVQALTDYESAHNLDSAKYFAEKFGKSYQSVISKIKNLELEYSVKPPPKKKAIKTTKAELAEWVATATDRNLDGLVGASRNSLLQLVNGIQHILADNEAEASD